MVTLLVTIDNEPTEEELLRARARFRGKGEPDARWLRAEAAIVRLERAFGPDGVEARELTDADCERLGIRRTRR